MRKLFFLFAILLWVCGAGVRMYAVPAQPQPRTIIQPDGTSITILLKGDEFFHYTVSEDNYLIAQDADGIYRYAGIDEQGEIYTLEMKVTESKTRSGKEKDFLKNLPSQAQLSERIGQLHTAKTRSNTAYKQTRYPLSGTPKALVILVEYTDVKFLTKHTSGSFVDMLNKQGYSDNGAMGSARDYFRDNSMGVFDPEFVVAGPYTLPNNMAYYGRNSGGDDVNVGQMIIDACRLADNDVNFSEFDTDGDGYVDNVFVFYAGYNEAEGGPANSVWPQRWTVNERVALDGVMLYDFACTSELRGYTGSEMCGIGTFVHEFGHVLGLPDYYATNGSKHATLGEWNVMDYGSYLNDGKTPPYYSAYDRFYLGWLQPVELIGSQYVSLEPLHQSNKAYLITPEGNHNLIGNDPDPTEFFVLENRQNEGWDTYLPGHGLLISRINYNRYLWENNCVNNMSTTMGFNIMAADKKWGESTMSGDPFPGTSGVNYYVPELRNKSLLENKRIHVQEKDGKIYLQYLEADGLLIPLAEEATDVTSSSLTANWQSVNDADAYRITLFSVTEGTSYYNQNFDAGFSGLTEWYRTFETTTTDENLCGETAPAALFTRMGDILQTENFFVSVAELSFHLKSASGANSELVLSGWNGETWKTVKTILVNSRSEGVQKMEFGLEQNYIQLRFEQTNTEGGFAIDDIAVVLHKKLNFQTENKLVYGNAETFTGLYPDLNYHYVVKAVKNEEGAEIVSLNSNKITANTAKDNNKNNKIRVIQAVGGVLELYVSSEYMDKQLYVYSTSGQLVKHISNITSNFTVIDHLPRQRMYIVKVGSSRVKLVML